MTNDLTYAMLEVIDEMSPILEPKPNVRLHRGTPDELLDKVVDMIADSQGAPFLLNFDERSMAGMLRQARKAGVEHLIHAGNVHDYAPVGCLENTMVGNDRSGTVDCNLNLLKAVELALTGGYDLLPFTDPMTGKTEPVQRWGPDTGDATRFHDLGAVLEAPTPRRPASSSTRSSTCTSRPRPCGPASPPRPTSPAWCRAAPKRGWTSPRAAPSSSYVTIEAVTYATTVDSLLAIKYLVFDEQVCTMAELVQALRDNWEGHEVLQARALQQGAQVRSRRRRSRRAGPPGDGSVDRGDLEAQDPVPPAGSSAPAC